MEHNAGRQLYQQPPRGEQSGMNTCGYALIHTFDTPARKEVERKNL